MKSKNVAVVGSGYVGLVTGACLAEIGHHVVCVDSDRAKVQMLKKGDIPIYEPGLPEVVAANRKARRLHFTTRLEDALKKAEYVFIAVNTPPLPNGEADLSGGDPRRHDRPGARESASGRERRNGAKGREGRLAPDGAEVDSRLGHFRRDERVDGRGERGGAREDARRRKAAAGQQGRDAFRERGREPGVVRGQDEACHRANRRRSARSAGARRARSPRIRRMVRGEESVETPRVLGK